MERQKILIVEDDADISGLLVKIMEGAGYQVRTGIFRNRGIVLYGTGITGLCAVGSDASGDDRRRGVGADPTGTEKRDACADLISESVSAGQGKAASAWR